MKYKIIQIISREICVPSQDYYARANDWANDMVNTIEIVSNKLFDTENECILHIIEEDLKGEFIFLRVYIRE